MSITLIAGPPGAGKTTWAKSQAKPDDLIIDLDIIRQSTPNEATAKAVRNELEKNAPSFPGDVFIVRTLADPVERSERAQRLKADRTVILATPVEEATRRATERDGNSDKSEPIKRWWKNYQPLDGEEVITPVMGKEELPDKEEPMSKRHNNPHLKNSEIEDDNSSNTSSDPGYPQNTPWRDMEPEEQVNYWRAQARKHEDIAKSRADYEELKADADKYRALEEETKDDVQKAVEQARSEALAEAESKFSKQLFDTHFGSIANQRGLDEKQRQAVLTAVNPNQFIEGGAVKVEALTDFFDALIPQQDSGPRVPQGHGGFRNSKPATGKERGAELADQFIK